jgi:2-keto-3-deoxy-L-rhamnonate aldolase RhmA
MDIPRLNGVIKALESGKPAFAPFSGADISSALTISGAAFDGVVFEMEHGPYDIKMLRDCMQYMLNRRQIATSGSIAPAVTPFVRIPPNGGEHSQWIAKQVLDMFPRSMRHATQSPHAGIHGRGRRNTTNLPVNAATRPGLLRATGG